MPSPTSVSTTPPGPRPGGTDRSARCTTNFSGLPRPILCSPNGFCAGPHSSTACTWCRRCRLSAAPSRTTCGCGSASVGKPEKSDGKLSRPSGYPPEMPGRETTRDHAVVIGGSIAGLSAARVLSDFYAQVTVYERDDLPSAPGNRATVPQD